MLLPRHYAELYMLMPPLMPLPPRYAIDDAAD